MNKTKILFCHLGVYCKRHAAPGLPWCSVQQFLSMICIVLIHSLVPKWARRHINCYLVIKNEHLNDYCTKFAAKVVIILTIIGV